MAITNKILKTANDVLKKTPIGKVEFVKKVIQILDQKELDVSRASLYWKKKDNQMKRIRYT